jgi:hypothetical protein
MSKRKRQALVSEEITVEAFLADSVANPDGKLYVQGGGWNVLNTLALPFRQSRIGIGVIIRVPYQLATNESHNFEVRLENADGTQIPLGDAPPGAIVPDGKVRKIGGAFPVGRPPGILPGDEQTVAIAVNIDALLFEQHGVYRFVISIDGRDLKHLRFRVNLIAQPQLLIR